MHTKRFFAGFIIVSLILAGIVSHYASGSPDGLEKVAADKGVAAQEEEHALAGSPLGDYGVEGVDNARLSGGLAGVIGVAAVLALSGGLFWTIRRRGGSGPAAGSRAGSSAGSRAD